MRKTTLLSILILTSTFSLNVFWQEISNEDNNFVTWEIIAQYKYSNFLPWWTVNIGDYQLKIEPKDTNKMMVNSTRFPNYVFDVQLNYKDFIKETFTGIFVLTDEVTYEENEGDE